MNRLHAPARRPRGLVLRLLGAALLGVTLLSAPAPALAAAPVSAQTSGTTPETYLLSQPEPSARQGAIPAVFGSDVAEAKFECTQRYPDRAPTVTRDCGRFLNLTIPLNTTGADYTIDFEIRAYTVVDGVESIDPTPATFSYTQIPGAGLFNPIVLWTQAPRAFETSTSATFAWQQEDDGERQQCSIDGTPFVDCTSPMTVTKASVGRHTLTVRSILGGRFADQRLTWTVVAPTGPVAPETYLQSFPGSAPNREGAIAAVFGSETLDTGFECTISVAGGASSTDDFCPRYYNALLQPNNTGSNIDRTISVRAYTRGTPRVYDPTPVVFTHSQLAGPGDADPVVLWQSGPQPLDPRTTARFTWSDDGDNETQQCRVDNAAYAPCTSGFQVSGLSVGDHVLRVLSTDPRSNKLGEQQFRWSVVLPAARDDLETWIVAGPPASRPQSVPGFLIQSNVPGALFSCEIVRGPASAAAGPVGRDFCNSQYIAPAALEPGVYTFRAAALTRDGRFDLTAALYEFEVLAGDEASSNFASGPQFVDPDPTPSFEFFTLYPGAISFECSLDEAPFSACGTGNSPGVSNPVTVGPVTPGLHRFEVRTVRDGVTSPRGSVYTWNAATEPVTGAVTATGGTSSTQTFSWPGDAGLTYECRLDGGDFAACTSPVTRSDLALGDHTFEVRAVSAPTVEGRTYRFVDATPSSLTITVAPVVIPETTILTRPAAVTGSSSATFTFSSDRSGATFQCSLDDAAYVACTSPRVYSGLGAGDHTFRVRATLDGQTDATPASYTWTITGTPDTTITDGPPATTGATTNSVSFGSDLPGATFECSLNNAAYAACTSPRTLRNQVAGSYTLRVRAVLNGNTDATPASRTWEVLTVPNTTIRTRPAASTTATTASFTFDASVAGSTFECALDSEPFTACTSPVTLTGLAVGSHTFEVRALNRGVPDPTPASFTWTVTEAPRAPDTTILTGPASPSASRSAAFTFEADVVGATFACSLDGAAYTPCSSPYSVSSLAEGDHTMRVRATAGGLTDATPASFTWAVDLAPTVTLGDRPAKTTSSLEATFTFSSNDAAADFECELDGVVSDCDSPFTADVDLGEHTFGVTAIDAGGQRSAQATYTWTVEEVVVETAPDTTITVAPVLLSNSRSATFEFAAVGQTTGFECRVDDQPFRACSSPLEVSGLRDGSHEFAVRARNGSLVDDTPATYTWTIDASGPRVRISGFNGEVLQGTRVTAVFSSRDLDVVEYRCALDDADLALCPSQVTYADLAPGRHQVRAVGVDALGNVTAEPVVRRFTVEVKLPETRLRGVDGGRFAGGTVIGQLGSPADDVRHFECRLDGGDWFRCSSPRLRLTGIDAGRHVLLARAVDGRGYRDATPARATFRMRA